MMSTSNPALNRSIFEEARSYSADGTMTIQGVVNKSLILLFLLILSASWVWNKVFQSMSFMGAGSQAPTVSGSVYPLMMVGLFGGMIFAFVTIFKKEWSRISAPVYAVCEGLFIGGISAVFEMKYPGVVMQAVALTFATLFSMLIAYKSGLIKATEKFKLGIVAATGAIFVVYLVNWIMSFFGASIPLINSSSNFGIGFSIIIVIIAALNLILDFDLIEQGASMGMPKYMEWYGAFALMVTLVWLYIEILRLLIKLRERR